MFYDGILLSIISKENATHDIIDEALNYLKLNNKRNAKVLTNIPYLIFKNLDFLANISSYTLINIKSSINEFKREIDIKTIKEVLKRFNIDFYGSRITLEFSQIFIKKIDKATIYKLRKELKDIKVLSISSEIIIYELNDILNSDLINNNYISNFIIVNSGNNYSLDKNSAYLGDISNVNSAKYGFLRLHNDAYFDYNYYADVIDYLNSNYNKDISEVILEILPEYYKNNFNDYYSRIYTLFEGPLYLIASDSKKLDVIVSKDNAFDVYIGYNDKSIYISNNNLNLFDVNKFYSVKNFLEIDLETKEIRRLNECLNSFKNRDNSIFVIEDNESNYESLFELNEDLIEICKDNISYRTFLNGIYPSVIKMKLDMFYTNNTLSKSIYFKNVFLSLSEYENILKLKNEFNICELNNNDIEHLIKENMDIIILNDKEYDLYSDLVLENTKKACFILVTEKYKFSDLATYLSNGISLIYPYKAYMVLKGLEEKHIIENNSISLYLRYLKNNISKLMSSYGMHYIKSFIGSNIYKEVVDKKFDKLMLIKLEEALKTNNYEKYLDYSSYLKNDFTYKSEISVDESIKKDYIKGLFKSILPVSADVRKYLNEALNMNISVLDKRFIQRNLTNEIFINFYDDSTNISLTDIKMYDMHKIMPNTPFVGLKYYFDIYSFKDLKALVSELKELNKDSFIIVKISNISNIVDYVTSGVDELIIDDINLLKEADLKLKELGLRNYILLSLEYDYLNAYDIIKAAINGSNRFYFKKSILLSLGCVGYNKCYKCPNGLFGSLKYYGNDIYLKRFIEFLSYETFVVASLIGYNGFSDKHESYLTNNSNINELILKNANSGITDMNCNAILDDNIGTSLRNIDRKLYVRINGNVGYNFGSYINSNITLSLNGTCQKYLGKCLDGGLIYIYNNMTNELNDDKNYLVGKNALYKANSGKVFINGYASSYFAFANNGATAIVLGMDDYGCSFMTNGIVVCLGEIGDNFAYNMTGGIAYIYDEFKNLESKVDKRLVDIVKIDGDDLLFLSNLINEFKDLTKSKKATALSKYINSDLFFKVVPKNYGVMLKMVNNKKKSGLSFDEAIKEVSKFEKA